MLSFGSLGVSFIFYLNSIGLNASSIGSLFTAILLGDLLISFVITRHADQWGRRSSLIVSALLQLLAGLSFLYFRSFVALAFFGALGVMSPGGGEVGPFQSVEQASLTETAATSDLASIMSTYSIIGYAGQALGALSSGVLLQYLSRGDANFSDHSVACIALYTALSLLLVVLYLPLSINIESLHPRSVSFVPRTLTTAPSDSITAIPTPLEHFLASQLRANPLCYDSLPFSSLTRSLEVSYCNRLLHTTSLFASALLQLISAHC